VAPHVLLIDGHRLHTISIEDNMKQNMHIEIAILPRPNKLDDVVKEGLARRCAVKVIFNED